MNLSRRTVAELFQHLKAIFNLRIHFMMAESEQLPFLLFCYFFFLNFFLSSALLGDGVQEGGGGEVFSLCSSHSSKSHL